MMRPRRTESPWAGDYANHALAYDRARPAYPEALIDRLVARVGVERAALGGQPWRRSNSAMNETSASTPACGIAL